MQTDPSAFRLGEGSLLTFTASGREYFGIWLVNFALSVLTLGVYSAWAKVRRLEYFHRHTRLAGATFDYHGSPIAILKGRVVALVLLAIYTVAGQASPLLGFAAFGAIGLVMPWLLVRSLMFRLHNTSYRGLRFRFCGSMAEAYWVFLALPVLTFLSLFTLGPFWHHRIKRYQIGRAAFGATPFTFHARIRRFYRVYFGALGLFMALAFGGGMLIAVVHLALGAGSRPHPVPVALTLTVLAVYGVTALGLRAFLDARIRVLAWNNTRLGDYRFICYMEGWPLFLLTVTNVLATILTLGLFLPFAQVRMARYMADAIQVVAGSSIDGFAASESQDASAVGDESVGMFDFDIAI